MKIWKFTGSNPKIQKYFTMNWSPVSNLLSKLTQAISGRWEIPEAIKSIVSQLKRELTNSASARKVWVLAKTCQRTNWFLTMALCSSRALTGPPKISNQYSRVSNTMARKWGPCLIEDQTIGRKIKPISSWLNSLMNPKPLKFRSTQNLEEPKRRT